jgi:hypothetical protein
VTLLAPEHHHLDRRLARVAVAWSLSPVGDQDDVAGQLVDLAAGNRTAVARALVMVPGGSPAAEVLRLTLARGEWAWSTSW